MNIFERVRKQYTEIDQLYAAREFEARRKGFNRKEDHWRQIRVLNDQAYFLFIFTRLEYEIRRRSIEVIQKRQARIRNWKLRSAWDILPSQSSPNSIHFRKRAALLLRMNSPDYQLVMRYYRQRNLIAHGGSFTIPMMIPRVMADIERLRRVMKV